MKASGRRMSNLRPLIVFCMSVLFVSAVGLGAVRSSLLASSVSVFAFLVAVIGLLAANLFTIVRPPRSGDEDGQ
ncbi:MAG: hypothetical protein JRN06_07500 [Nitrososphaerota archaeon]|nr:hypothetical protein [Nitrososphaerota archaeon]MDG7024373.1 hypothetical protein [Nitrososphaerota archaeon]